MTNEIAVISGPEGGNYAVAVFTRADVPFVNQPRINGAMARVAMKAIEYLRP